MDLSEEEQERRGIEPALEVGCGEGERRRDGRREPALEVGCGEGERRRDGRREPALGVGCEKEGRMTEGRRKKEGGSYGWGARKRGKEEKEGASRRERAHFKKRAALRRP